MTDEKRELENTENHGAGEFGSPRGEESGARSDAFGGFGGSHSETVYGEEIVPEHLDELPDIENVEDYVGGDHVYDEETAGALVALMFAKEHREELDLENIPRESEIDTRVSESDPDSLQGASLQSPKTKKKKRGKAVWLCIPIILLLILGVYLFMPEFIFTDGEYSYRVDYDFTASLVGYNGGATDVVVPENMGSFVLKSIGGAAFNGNDKIKNVSIPDSVTTIYDGAFSRCISLESVDLPEGLTSIAAAIFQNCMSLKEISIPRNVKSIGAVAFQNCHALVSLEIPLSVASIGNHAFSGCSSLSDIRIPDNVVSIGDYAFCDCTDLSSIVIPDGVTSIGDEAFSGCSNLVDVSIPGSIESMGEYAFRDCTGLSSIVIPDGVTSIGNCAFYYCTGLESVSIGKDVSVIGNSAFLKCENLSSVHISDIAAWCNIRYGDDHSRSTSDNPLYYAGALYLNGELVTELVIPEGVGEISDYAFQNCDSLTSVVITNGLTRIGNSAFSSCDNLKSVVIPDGVTMIDYSAFSACSGLTNVVIPDSVTSIGEGAFYNCYSLTSVVIPESVMYMDGYVFNGCDNLTIYCEAVSLPKYWDGLWNFSRCPVVWGYKSED